MPSLCQSINLVPLAAMPIRSPERLCLSANTTISCGYAAERTLSPFDLSDVHKKGFTFAHRLIPTANT